MKWKMWKIGRVNANDGGIDYLLLPVGRVFQATETLDLKKYYLDIEKVGSYPITFVIKSKLTSKELLQKIKKTDQKKYVKYITEIISIPTIESILKKLDSEDKKDILKEFEIQYKREFQVK